MFTRSTPIFADNLFDFGIVAEKLHENRDSYRPRHLAQFKNELNEVEKAVYYKDQFNHLNFINERLDRQYSELQRKSDDNSNLISSYKSALREIDRDELDLEVDRRLTLKYDEVVKRERMRKENMEREIKALQRETVLRDQVNSIVQDRNQFMILASAV